MLARLLPLIGIILFFGVGFIWRSWLQYRRHGTLGIILFHSTHRDQRLRDSLFVLLLVAMTAQSIVEAVAPDFAARFSIALPLVGGLGTALGAELVFGGTAFMAIAQLRLGASWRIGIEESASPGLVTGGMYQFCRNPIFLGMFITLIGLALLMPTWISAAVLIGSLVCVRSQVLEEEVYLSATYRDAYRRYASRVGRFIPGLGILN